MKKRFLCLLLALVMVLGMIPMTTLAANESADLDRQEEAVAEEVNAEAPVYESWDTDGKGHYLNPEARDAYYWIERVDFSSELTSGSNWYMPGVGSNEDGESVWMDTPVLFMGGTMGYLGYFSSFDLENKRTVFEQVYQNGVFINGGANSTHEVRLYDVFDTDGFYRPGDQTDIYSKYNGVFLRAYSVYISNVSDNQIGFPGNTPEADALMHVTMDGVKMQNSDVNFVPNTYHIVKKGANRPSTAYPSAFYDTILAFSDRLYLGDAKAEIHSVNVNGISVEDGDTAYVTLNNAKIEITYDSDLYQKLKNHGCSLKHFSRYYLNGNKINVAALTPVSNGDGTSTKTYNRTLNEGDELMVETWLEVTWPDGTMDIVDECTFTVREKPQITAFECDKEAYAGDNITLSWDTNFTPLKVRILRYSSSTKYTTFDLEDPTVKEYKIPMIKAVDPPIKVTIGIWYGEGNNDYITQTAYVERLYGVYVKTNLLDNQYHSGEATLTLQGETEPRYTTTWTDGYHALYDYGVVGANAFAFNDVRPGTYTLKIQPDGFSAQTATVTVGSADVTTKDFAMKYYCTGSVSGVRDTDVTTITLWKKQGDGTYTKTDYSDTVTGNGNYSIQMVDQATYRVVATCPGYAENITPKDLTASGSRHFTMTAIDYDGLVAVDGVWGYYEGGVLQTDFTGLVPYGDLIFYVENGILDFTYTGLAWYNDAWTYVANSQLTQGYTGLVWFNDNWFYVVDSVIDWTFTGLVPYEGNYFYVQNNLLDWSYTGLGYHDGGWYFIQNGLLQKEYSGLVYFNDNWFYVEEGVLTYQYFGMVEYEGNLFYVQASHLDWSYTGLGYHEGAWYYFQNALYTPSFTGLVPFEGSLFYVKDGTVDWTYNGTAVYEGVTYTVKDGAVVL